MRYKVVWHDGYDRDNIADRVVAENLGFMEAYAICMRLRRESRCEGDWWKTMEQHEHVWGGMAEFI